MDHKMIKVEDTGLSFETNLNLERMDDLAREMIIMVGEDVTREGLVKTPRRVAEAWAFLTRGYHQTLEQIVNGAVFEAESSEMILVSGVEFYSVCEHHLLPFFGKVHIGYIPDKKILGLSKFARIADMFARRLQLQERLATQIAEAVVEVLRPQGVGVVIEGLHLCMMMRGVEKQHSKATTSAMRGIFKKDARTREEFLRLIHTQE